MNYGARFEIYNFHIAGLSFKIIVLKQELI